MSEEQEPQIPNLTINMSGSASFDTADEALEALVQLREAEFGDLFTERETELDSEEDEGISVLFYHEEKRNQLHLITNSENNLNISLSVEGDSCEEAKEILDDILDYVSPITIEEIVIAKRQETPFEDLVLPIDRDSEYDVAGVRIRESETDHIIQEFENGFSILSKSEVEQELSGDVETDFIQETIDRTEQFIQRVSGDE